MNFDLVSESTKELLIAFGANVKKIRKSKGMTQLEVSSAMNRDQQSLQRVESGRVNPSLSYIVELAKALNVSPQDLLDFNPH